MIPHGWKSVMLGKLTDGNIKNGYSPNPPEQDEGYWVLSLGALTGDGIDIREIKPAPNETKVLSSILKKNDFLISRSNTRDKVGRSARINFNVSNISFPDLMMRFRANTSLINEIFLELALKSQSSLTHFQSKAVGSSVTMVKINKTVVETLPILLPPLSEQEQIAHILTTWDAAIVCTQKLIENSKQQKKALMQQLLTGQRRLPGFSMPWKRVRIKELFTDSKRPISWDDEKLYPLLSVKRRSGGVFFRESLFGKNIKTKKLNIVRQNNLLISKMQVVHGAIGLVPKLFDGYYVSNSYLVLSPKNSSKLSMDFIDYYFQQLRIYHLAYLNSYGVHIEKMTFNFESFVKEKIELPSDINEQKAIADVLTAADALIAQYEARLAHLQMQKKALMQQLLTGKIRVAPASSGNASATPV